eukprot:scaffold23250_cov31-Tisochrysis_lutea.AAC.4
MQLITPPSSKICANPCGRGSGEIAHQVQRARAPLRIVCGRANELGQRQSARGRNMGNHSPPTLRSLKGRSSTPTPRSLKQEQPRNASVPFTLPSALSLDFSTASTISCSLHSKREMAIVGWTLTPAARACAPGPSGVET